MANNLTDAAELLILDWLHGVGTPTRPTTPLKLALMKQAGSESAAGTELTGGSYARQDVTLSAASAGACTNSADVVFTGLPAVTAPDAIVGVEIWNSTGTVRLWWGPLDASKTSNAGDALTIAAGSLDLALN